MSIRSIYSDRIRRLTYLALLTAIVFVLQISFSAIRIGVFSVTLVLLPVVLGAALCGPIAAGWLGFVFSVAVLVSGDANLFLAIDPLGTVVTVILKGTIAGLITGLVFWLLSKKNRYLAVIVSAAVCPIVNTGIFLVGCNLFFFDTISAGAAAEGFDNPFMYAITFFVGFNFLFELAYNVIFSPVLYRLLNMKAEK